MKFEHNGRSYFVEFERQHKQIKQIDDLGKEREHTSTFPYTTVRLIEVVPGAKDKMIYRSATVGCWHKEGYGFTKETGRLRALRDVCRTLSKEMKVKLWEAYHTREGSTK